ncbi:MAG TPA: hypothetical protein VFA71_02130 [Terriglobales bacterium]|nr:hypothetical protein [Terriglobales bacterium]
MQYLRSAVVAFIFILTIIIFLAGCGGGHSNTIGPITTITLTPNPTVSLNDGDVITMGVSATDAKGNTVSNQTFTFNSDKAMDAVPVQISNALVSVTTVNALLCAGRWDSLSNPIVCNAATGSQTAHITATAQGVTSNTVTVNVHPKVARVVITQTFPSGNCVSQGAGFTYLAQAFDGATPPNNISNQVGNFTWTIGDSSIGTITTTTPPDSSGLGSTNSAFAVIPGLTTVTASVNTTNPVNSAAVPFQECPVASIAITGAGSSNTTVFSPSPAAVGATQQLSFTVLDSNGIQVNNPVPTLTWNTTQPAVATVSSGLVTAVAPGTSTITASCALNTTCNKNQNALATSNPVIASVAGSSATSVYAIASGTTSLVPIDTTTNIPGTAISLPAGANSLFFDPQGANAYLGSSSGLMVVNATNNTFTKTVSNATGTVLAVSPNGQLILLGNSGGSTFLYNNSANTVTALNITSAVAADFSPDSSEAVVVNQNTPATPATSTSTVYVVQGTTVRTVATLSAPGASAVSFLPNGALAYIANATTPFVTACNNVSQNGSSSVAITNLKGIVDPSNPTNPNIVLGASSPNIAVIKPTLSGTSCPPTISETRATVSLGAGNFTANQLIVTPDGTHAYVPAGNVNGKLLGYNVVGNAAAAVNLSSGTAVTTTGGATLDSASVYVGVNDGGNGSVHKINVSAGTDAVQIPLSFVPDLVAVRPH